MMALSIRQPWAWFILEGYKRYENRAWNRAYIKAQLELCPIGSDFLIHASKGMTEQEYEEACEFAMDCEVFRRPGRMTMQRGGIVGIVHFDGIVRASKDAWFTGPIALKLSNPYPLPFVPCRGQLGFFDVDWLSVKRPAEILNPEAKAA